MDVYHRLGVRTLINARGCATLVGGSLMDDEVLAAMASAARAFVRMEDLEEAAGRVIAQATGAETGYVTSGAAAAVTLATAACITGSDADKMNRLPDTADMPAEVLIQRAHRNPYDHMVRAAGARLVEFGGGESATRDMRDAIGPRTVAAFYHAAEERLGLPFDVFVRIAHERDIPVIVDASMSLPPASNLRRFVAEGADLVAYSGGKSIRGPQASGFLAGQSRLLLAVGLQHQDMDVNPVTWTRRSLLERGVLARVPEHGIGRPMKAGKEEIVGLLVALERYVERDHAGEAGRWSGIVDELAREIGRIPGLEAAAASSPDARPVPVALVHVDEYGYGRSATELATYLQEASEPRIALGDHEAQHGRLLLNPENLGAADVVQIVQAFRDGARPA